MIAFQRGGKGVLTQRLKMFGSFGWMELLLILFIVLIIFGAGKLPQLGEGLGKAIKGFKKTVHEADAVEVTATPAPPEQLAQQSQAAPPGQPAESGQPQAAPIQAEQSKQG